MQLSSLELYKIKGGSSLSASMLSSIAKLFETVFDIGEAIGSSLRRIIYKKMC